MVRVGCSNGQLRFVREITSGQLHTTLTKCRACHIERLNSWQSSSPRDSLSARQKKSFISAVLTAWSRTVSSSSKDGKTKDGNNNSPIKASASPGSPVGDAGGRAPDAEQQKLIRSIANAVSGPTPTKPSEQISRLEGAMSELEKLQMSKNNSSGPTKPVLSNLTSDTKQKLRELKIRTKVVDDIRRKQQEYYKNFTDNNYLDLYRAKEEYLLTDKDLESIPKLKRRNPYSSTYSTYKFIDVVMLRDVIKKVNEVYGSVEAMEKERKRRDAEREKAAGVLFSISPESVKKSFKDKLKQMFQTSKNAFYHDDSGKVVFLAFAINLANAVFKFFVWLKTGSPSMFSEFMHSCGDTANQLMLAIGKYLSMQKPDSEHPYGYVNHIHIMSIVSGVGIFCFGFGLTFYNGIIGLLTPQIIEAADLTGALKVLTGSLVSELATLFTAVVRIHQESKKKDVSFWKYVKEGDDPLVNVVLLEDLSAVLGVLVCGAAMYLSVATGLPRLDAVGSLAISLILGGVSYFIVHTNADVLLGRSIPYQQDIVKALEQDRFVRSVMDSKGTDYGMYSRYKAELHLDGRQIAMDFMETIDTEELIKKLKVASPEETTELLTQFGEGCVDRVSLQIDRIEEDLKRNFPELRHIDLEV